MSDEIHTLTCKCGKETASGPNLADVKAAMERHMAKAHPAKATPKAAKK